MKPPKAYKEWCDCLDIFERGDRDAEIVQCMQKGKLSWQYEVAERFSHRVYDVFSARLVWGVEKFERSCKTGKEMDLAKCMIDLRRLFALLHVFSEIPAFDQGFRSQLVDAVRESATYNQKSLEEIAKSDRSGRTLVLIRRNDLRNYLETSVKISTDNGRVHTKEQAGNVVSDGRRRILL